MKSQSPKRWWQHAITLGLASLLSTSAVHAQSKPELFDETKVTTLFAFDEVSIPFTQNLKVEMTTPTKHPENPVVRRGEPGTADNWAVQFYGSIIKVDGKYRMWYAAASRGGDQEGATNQVAADVSYWRVAYAESDDGVKWTKPNFGLVSFAGNKNNNLVKIDPQNVSMLNVKVLYDPEDPNPQLRYKMTGHGYWTKVAPGGSRTLGTLVVFGSPDGLTWKSLTDVKPDKRAFVRPEDVLLQDSHFEPSGGLYKWDGLYYISGQNAVSGARPYHGRVPRTYVSGDFINWTKASNISMVRTAQYTLLGSGRSREAEQIHEGISVWNRGNVLLGVFGQWHGGKEWPEVTIDLGFAVSNDGVSFRQPMDEWTIIPKGKDGEWDQGGLIQGQGFENVGDQTFMYYGAWDPRQWQSAPPRGGVGIVSVPRDRIGVLTPDPKTVGDSVYHVQKLDCDFITAPVTSKPGTTFYINADGLNDQATLKVELLDSKLKPLPGYSGDAAAVIKQSGFQTPVLFAGKDALPDSVRVKVTYLGTQKTGIRFSALYVK